MRDHIRNGRKGVIILKNRLFCKEESSHLWGYYISAAD